MEAKRTFTQEQAQAMYEAIKSLTSWDIQDIVNAESGAWLAFERCEQALAELDTPDDTQQPEYTIDKPCPVCGEDAVQETKDGDVRCQHCDMVEHFMMADDTPVADLDFDLSEATPEQARKLVDKIDDMLPDVIASEARYVVKFNNHPFESEQGYMVWDNRLSNWYGFGSNVSSFTIYSAESEAQAEADRLNAGNGGGA